MSVPPPPPSNPKPKPKKPLNWLEHTMQYVQDRVPKLPDGKQYAGAVTDAANRIWPLPSKPGELWQQLRVEKNAATERVRRAGEYWTQNEPVKAMAEIGLLTTEMPTLLNYGSQAANLGVPGQVISQIPTQVRTTLQETAKRPKGERKAFLGASVAGSALGYDTGLAEAGEDIATGIATRDYPRLVKGAMTGVFAIADVLVPLLPVDQKVKAVDAAAHSADGRVQIVERLAQDADKMVKEDPEIWGEYGEETRKLALTPDNRPKRFKEQLQKVELAYRKGRAKKEGVPEPPKQEVTIPNPIPGEAPLTAMVVGAPGSYSIQPKPGATPATPDPITGLYSQLEHTLKTHPKLQSGEKMHVPKMLDLLRGSGVKLDELESTGVMRILEERRASKTPVTGKEILDQIETDRFEILRSGGQMDSFMARNTEGRDTFMDMNQKIRELKGNPMTREELNSGSYDHLEPEVDLIEGMAIGGYGLDPYLQEQIKTWSPEVRAYAEEQVNLQSQKRISDYIQNEKSWEDYTMVHGQNPPDESAPHKPGEYKDLVLHTVDPMSVYGPVERTPDGFYALEMPDGERRVYFTPDQARADLLDTYGYKHATHWGGSKGVKVHARVRYDNSGLSDRAHRYGDQETIMVIEELQSDWDQARRDHGTRDRMSNQDARLKEQMQKEKELERAQGEISDQIYEGGTEGISLYDLERLAKEIKWSNNAQRADEFGIPGRSPNLHKQDVAAAWAKITKNMDEDQIDLVRQFLDLEQQKEALYEKGKLEGRKVPAGSHAGTTTALMLKNILWQAAQDDVDGIVATSGEVQNNRWKSETRGAVEYVKVEPTGSHAQALKITVFPPDGDEFAIYARKERDGHWEMYEPLRGDRTNNTDLAAVFGKEMVQKFENDWYDMLALDSEITSTEYTDIDIGTRGMTEFYDKTVPNTMKRILTEIGVPEEGIKFETVKANDKWMGRVKLQKLVLTPEIKKKVREQGFRQFKIDNATDPARDAQPVTLNLIQEHFGKGVEVFEIGPGNFVAHLPNGNDLYINAVGEIKVDLNDPNTNLMLSAYDEETRAGVVAGTHSPVGEYRTLDRGGIINIVESASLPHELYHAFFDLALYQEEKQILLESFQEIAQELGISPEELGAEDYTNWLRTRRSGIPDAGMAKWAAQLYERVTDMMYKVYGMAAGKTKETIYREMATGEIWKRAEGGRKGSGSGVDAAGFAVKRNPNREEIKPPEATNPVTKETVTLPVPEGRPDYLSKDQIALAGKILFDTLDVLRETGKVDENGNMIVNPMYETAYYNAEAGAQASMDPRRYFKWLSSRRAGAVRFAFLSFLLRDGWLEFNDNGDIVTKLHLFHPYAVSDHFAQVYGDGAKSTGVIRRLLFVDAHAKKTATATDTAAMHAANNLQIEKETHPRGVPDLTAGKIKVTVPATATTPTTEYYETAGHPLVYDKLGIRKDLDDLMFPKAAHATGLDPYEAGKQVLEKFYDNVIAKNKKYFVRSGEHTRARARGHDLVYRTIRHPDELAAIFDSMVNGTPPGQALSVTSFVTGHREEEKRILVKKAFDAGAIPVFTTPYPNVALASYGNPTAAAGWIDPFVVAIEYDPNMGRSIAYETPGLEAPGRTRAKEFRENITFEDAERVIDGNSVVSFKLLHRDMIRKRRLDRKPAEIAQLERFGDVYVPSETLTSISDRLRNLRKESYDGLPLGGGLGKRSMPSVDALNHPRLTPLKMTINPYTKIGNAKLPRPGEYIYVQPGLIPNADRTVYRVKEVFEYINTKAALSDPYHNKLFATLEGDPSGTKYPLNYFKDTLRLGRKPTRLKIHLAEQDAPAARVADGGSFSNAIAWFNDDAKLTKAGGRVVPVRDPYTRTTRKGKPNVKFNPEDLPLPPGYAAPKPKE